MIGTRPLVVNDETSQWPPSAPSAASEAAAPSGDRHLGGHGRHRGGWAGDGLCDLRLEGRAADLGHRLARHIRIVFVFVFVFAARLAVAVGLPVTLAF